MGTSCSLDDLSVKMGDLRAKEQKLKKWEDDLKRKENTLSETSKEKTKLNSFIKKLKAEKEENQLTIRTLLNRIDSIELKINNHNNKCPVDNLNNHNGHVDNANRQNEQLIQSVHNKVTNYILRQIDIQISKLDMQDTCVQDSKVGGEMNSNPVVQRLFLVLRILQHSSVK